jgi:hypothetical protein
MGGPAAIRMEGPARPSSPPGLGRPLASVSTFAPNATDRREIVQMYV